MSGASICQTDKCADYSVNASYKKKEEEEESWEKLPGDLLKSWNAPRNEVKRNGISDTRLGKVEFDGEWSSRMDESMAIVLIRLATLFVIRWDVM